MKSLLFSLLLAPAAAAAQMQAPPPSQAELRTASGAIEPKGATTIKILTADSASITYKKAVAGLLAQGYGIDKSDKDALFLSTPAKSVDGSVFIKIQLVVAPASGGSVATFRSTFTWVSATTIMAHVENRELPVQFAGGAGGPSKRAWAAMKNAAVAALPGVVSYN